MARPLEVLSNWHILLDDLSLSAKEFYGAVEQALAERKVPDAKVTRVDWKEGGLFSAKREYMRISRGDLFYDVCAAPFGNGYFISSWMASWVPIPIVDRIMSLFGKRATTFYTLDTRHMFQESVHRALVETLGGMRSARGLRALSPDETRMTTKNPLN